MRRFWLLALLFGLSYVQLYSQTPLDEPVSLHAEELPLEQALYNLIENSSVRLSFSNSILPKDKIITIDVVNQPLRKVLELLLADTDIGYQVVGSQVALIRKPPPPVVNKSLNVNGFVKDRESGEYIVGAVVQNDQMQGTYTNEFGYFSLTIRKDTFLLMVSSLGYEPDTVWFLGGGSWNKIQISLKPAYLTEVVVNSQPDSIILETSPGVIVFNLEQADRLTALGGEADLMRLAYSLPGIQTGADGIGGISVRGGNVDQNLFLLDGVPVYNATHGLGIFSIYYSSAIRSAKILKGVFPAQYGGRASSVWDIQTKEGNSKKISGVAELGFSSAQLTLEGPLAHNRGSFFVSGRRAMFDFLSVPLSRKLRSQQKKDGFLSYYFFDLNFKTNYELSPKDHLFLSLYRGRDYFKDYYDQRQSYQDTLSLINNRERDNWGNDVISLRWNRLLTEKLFSNTTIAFSQYLYQSENYVGLDVVAPTGRINRDVLLLRYDSYVRDFALKTDFDYSANNEHRMRIGAAATRHHFQPGIVSFEEAMMIDSIQTDTLGAWNKRPIQSLEFDLYFQDEFKIGDFVEINLGIRASALAVEREPRYSLQPRALFKVKSGEKTTLHLSAGKMTQFLHLLSSSTIGLPKDLWVSATPQAPPQHVWQLSGGLTCRLNQWWSIEFESYYKWLSNLIYFQGSGLENINGANWQNYVSGGEGRTLGAELLLKVEKKKIGGWLSYTYSKSDRKHGLDVNKGREFPYRLDRRHNLSIQLLYKMSLSWDFTAGFELRSGTAFNFPTQQYEFVQAPGGYPVAIISNPKVIDRLNDDRYPVYHRLDFAFNHYFKIRNARHELKLGVYNAYFRQNPLYYTIRDDFDENRVLQRKLVQVSLLPIFPTLRYSIQF